ncbi:hypothetical protein ABZE59_027135, partial [Enterobacter cloacae subsp. cloacae]
TIPRDFLIHHSILPAPHWCHKFRERMSRNKRLRNQQRNFHRIVSVLEQYRVIPGQYAGLVNSVTGFAFNRLPIEQPTGKYRFSNRG